MKVTLEPTCFSFWRAYSLNRAVLVSGFLFELKILLLTQIHVSQSKLADISDLRLDIIIGQSADFPPHLFTHPMFIKWECVSDPQEGLWKQSLHLNSVEQGAFSTVQLRPLSRIGEAKFWMRRQTRVRAAPGLLCNGASVMFELQLSIGSAFSMQQRKHNGCGALYWQQSPC